MRKMDEHKKNYLLTLLNKRVKISKPGNNGYLMFYHGRIKSIYENVIYFDDDKSGVLLFDDTGVSVLEIYDKEV